MRSRLMAVSSLGCLSFHLLHAMLWAMGLSEEEEHDEEGRAMKNGYKNSIIE